jgi:hypothetical protein
MIARCARLPSSPGLAGAAKDRSRCIRPVTHFYSGKPMHFYSGVDRDERSTLDMQIEDPHLGPKMAAE